MREAAAPPEHGKRRNGRRHQGDSAHLPKLKHHIRVCFGRFGSPRQRSPERSGGQATQHHLCRKSNAARHPDPIMPATEQAAQESRTLLTRAKAERLGPDVQPLARVKSRDHVKIHTGAAIVEL